MVADQDRTSRENQIILENQQLEAAVIAQLLEREFGIPWDKEKVRTRRKRLKRALRQAIEAAPADDDQCEGEPVDTVQAYDDPNNVVIVPFGPGDVCWVINDLHMPHHDKRALDVAMAVARDVKPTHGIVNGDALDFAVLGKFPNHPQTPDLSREMAIARPVLKEIKGLISGRAEYKQGNHDHRYIRWIWEQGGVVRDLLMGLDAPAALDLQGWVMTGYHQDTELAGFRVTHGEVVRKFAGYSAKAEFEARLLSGISGHTHRAGTYTRTAAGREFQWTENGCLCRKDMSYIGAKGADWQHAFSFLRHDGQHVQVEQIRIVDYRAFYAGRLYTAGS